MSAYIMCPHCQHFYVPAPTQGVYCPNCRGDVRAQPMAAFPQAVTPPPAPPPQAPPRETRGPQTGLGPSAPQAPSYPSPSSQPRPPAPTPQYHEPPQPTAPNYVFAPRPASPSFDLASIAAPEDIAARYRPQIHTGRLATVTERFLARACDRLVLAASPTLGIVACFAPIAMLEEPLFLVWSILGPMILVQAIQATLICTRGQSLGKLWMGTKIVTVEGQAVGFIDGYLLREFLFGSICIIPGIGALLQYCNDLCVFRDDHRMLHDQMANTMVIVPDVQA